jgi:hypothetical protein
MGSKNVEKGLDFWGWKADTYYNISQLRLGDPKGLPCFFVRGGVFRGRQQAAGSGLGRPLSVIRGDCGGPARLM